MFQDAISAAGGRIEHDRCQRQEKGERDSVRNKGCEQERSSTQISNGVKGNDYMTETEGSQREKK